MEAIDMKPADTSLMQVNDEYSINVRKVDDSNYTWSASWHDGYAVGKIGSGAKHSENAAWLAGIKEVKAQQKVMAAIFKDDDKTKQNNSKEAMEFISDVAALLKSVGSDADKAYRIAELANRLSK